MMGEQGELIFIPRPDLPRAARRRVGSGKWIVYSAGRAAMGLPRKTEPSANNFPGKYL
jgi:hypothetical protein